jgi:hypothetical protein
MLNAVTISKDAADLPALCEALVYYGRVNLIVSSGSLADLVIKFGYENLIKYLDLGVLELVYEQHTSVVLTRSNPLPVHSFQTISLARTAQGRRIDSPADEMERTFIQAMGRGQRTRSIIRDLAMRLVVRDSSADVLVQAKQDALDLPYLRKALLEILAVLVPEYRVPTNLEIDVLEVEGGIVLGTNLNMTEINRLYHHRVSPTHSSITPAYLLAYMLDTRKEILYSSAASSDLWLSSAHAALLKARVETLFQRVAINRQHVDYFQMVEFQGRSVQAAIRQGERTPSELVAFLENEETIRFKAWLVEQNADAGLLREYDRAVLSQIGFTQRLPFKASKMVTFAALGAVADVALGTMGLSSVVAAGMGIAADVALSSSDEFLLSKIRGGWKPNQWVDTVADEFLRNDPK